MSELTSKQSLSIEETETDESEQPSEVTAEKTEESIEQLFRKEFEVSDEDIPAFHEPVEEGTIWGTYSLGFTRGLKGLMKTGDNSVSGIDELRLSELAAEQDELEVQSELDTTAPVEDSREVNDFSVPENLNPIVDSSGTEETIESTSEYEQQPSSEIEPNNNRRYHST